MQKKRLTLWIGGAVVVILFLFVYLTYNSLINRDEDVNNKWADVQITYQLRLNLVPNLVSIVKGVSEFEQNTLESIALARSRAISGKPEGITAGSYDQQRVLQDSVATAANRLIVRLEKYPVLKGTDAYVGLQVQLEGIERRIKVARNDFNKAVASYNTKVRSFPSSIVAGIFGFRRKEGFEATTGADKAVEIKF
jgi:LemA protein